MSLTIFSCSMCISMILGVFRRFALRRQCPLYLLVSSLAVMAFGLGVCCGAAPAPREEPKRRPEEIRSYVSGLDRQKLPVTEKEVLTGTDYGGTLLIYGPPARPLRLRLIAGLSYSDSTTDYYFCDGKLCYLKEEITRYGMQRDGSRDTSKVLKRIRREWAVDGNRMSPTTNPTGDEEEFGNPRDNGVLAQFLMKHLTDDPIDMESQIRP